MRIALFIAVSGAALAASASAQEAPPFDMGQLPDDRVPVLLQPGDRNPFARREARVAENVEDSESEESRLRALLEAMPVSGVIRGEGGVKVLLGSLILETGRALPPLMDGQAERLAVGAITSERAEILFVEENENIEPRKILIPVDLRPRVPVSPPPLPEPAKRPSASTPSTSARATLR